LQLYTLILLKVAYTELPVIYNNPIFVRSANNEIKDVDFSRIEFIFSNRIICRLIKLELLEEL